MLGRSFFRGEATDRRAEMMQSRKAQQYKRAAELLKTFSEKGVPTELQIEAREMERHDEQQRTADQALAAELRKLSSALPAAARKFWKEPVTEVTKALDEAPDAIRRPIRRLAQGQVGTGNTGSGPLCAGDVELCRRRRPLDARPGGGGGDVEGPRPGSRILARGRAGGEQRAGSRARQAAMGSDRRGKRDGPAARDLVGDRRDHASHARGIGAGSHQDAAPPLAEVDDNPPTDYAVRVPPEYHRLRSYPAVMVLHSGKGPDSAIDEMAAEAARRGYILIAPEYMTAGGAARVSLHAE